ncbi:MAG: alkaline phosphatase family protein, partial [Bacteroidales bacterium]|nr:alkaline phosphatase family protein [Bacteroidales bacterium]
MKKFLYCLILTQLTCFTGLNAQSRSRIPSEKPRLIISIVVDQMRYDYIHRYWEKFGEDGIRKLV